MISVMCPSRNRPTELLDCLNSLDLAKHDMEALVWLDTDDPQLNKYKELFESNPNVKLFIKDRVGYIKFHIMLNFLSAQAKYDWIFEFNDDAYFDNPNWYDVLMNSLKSYDPKTEPIVINIWGQGKTVGNLFPIVSRAYVNALGHFALSPNCDDWVRIIATGAGISHDVIGIQPKHRKYGGENILKDATFYEVEKDRAEHKKNWNEKRRILPQEQIDKDINNLLLRKNK
jgi:hypothetical protein